MTLSDVKVAHGKLSLSMPCFKSKANIEAGAQLMYEKEDEAAGDAETHDEQPKKRPKKS